MQKVNERVDGMYQDFFNKNDDYLDEFRQKVANQKIATIEERRTEMAHSRNNFLGTIAGIGLACVVGWFVLSPQYVENNKEIPVIHRPSTSVKIKPENPGGMDIPNQDKDVYNIVEKKEVDNTVIENLLPSPEQPKLPDIVPEVADLNENATNLDEIVDEVTDKTAETIETADNNIPQKPEDVLAPAQEKQAADVKTEKETAKKETEAKQPEVETTKPTPQAGAWQLQFIASKNKTAVEKLWNDLTAKYSELKVYPHEIQTADLGAQGTFYKLRAGSFASKNEAQNACARLKAKGLTDCIAKER
ncbi:MAG: SPOR domain-containing protein [Alphaproteobacteria bacterium]|nr:SPOR domain-containing protein [Alphaproteobacteria bacterium]